MVGFNNLNFDYPIIHNVALSRQCSVVTAELFYAECERLINDESPFKSIREPLIPQVDLFLINHLDNAAKRTSLKAIEYKLGMADIQDLPFPVGKRLTSVEMDTLIKYNKHDVLATSLFLKECLGAITFRDDLTRTYGVDFTNFNDVKIGVEVFAQVLEPDRSGRSPRSNINIDEIILPMVSFNSPSFQHIERTMRSRSFDPKSAKGLFSGLTATIDGFDYDFGVGGIHGSISPRVVESDVDNVIIDLDVASYYPNLAIVNGLYPEHIGPRFCEVYGELYKTRKKYPKGHPLNQAMKLALNGTFGKTNSEFSFLYDPKYTFTITINGQLLIAMFAEWLLGIESVSVLQVNTDGITILCNRRKKDEVLNTAKQWENHTGLQLEHVEYSKMCIRDVNNYLAVTTDGKVKRKGAYEHSTQWHQDPSMPVVAMCAEKVLLHGEHPSIAVMTHKNLMDFCVRVKVRSSDKLIDSDGNEYGRISRCVVTREGVTLSKHMPPTGVIGHYKKNTKTSDAEYEAVDNSIYNPAIHTKNKSVHTNRVSDVLSGRRVTMLNTMRPIQREKIDYNFYIEEVEKLTSVML